MRQTSLLDSFIKKTKGSQESVKKEQSESQLSSELNSSSIKENIKNLNVSEPSEMKFRGENRTTGQKPQIQTRYESPEKMEIEEPLHKQPQEDIEESESPQLRKLKKQTTGNSAVIKKQSLSKVKKNQSSNKKKKNKKNSDDEESYEINSESLEDEEFEDDDQEEVDEKGESFGDEEEDDEDFVKKSKRKNKTVNNKSSVKKKTNNKNQLKSQEFINFKKESEEQKVKKPEEISEETMLFDRSKFTDATPSWAIPGNPDCKDKYGVSCKSSHYDETTLKIPEYVWTDSTAPMKQYWKIKSENFDKVIFFKLGKFYELFYEDALLGNQLFDLKWMGTKMHVGFPEKCLDKYTQEFIRHGIKVVVVEQMETPDEMNNRIKQEKEQGKKVEKTLKREITEIVTKGTFQSNNEEIYLPNYLMTLYRYENYIAYSLLEMGTNSVLMGIVDGFEEFKTILYQTRPSELVYDPDNLPKEYVDIMKENIEGMTLSKLMNKQNLWHHLNATNEIQQMEEKGSFKKPKILETIERFDSVPKNLMISTLSGLFEYLHRVYKFEYVLATAKFKFYEREKALTHMVLDSQALQHLEVFETAAGEIGSLFEKIDRTKSKFGKRLFRRWMTSPLLSEYQINQRLDAVSDLRELGNEIDRIHSNFTKLPDLEKLCNKLYKYSVANTAAASAVYFSDLSTTRLKEFDTFMRSIEDSLIIFKLLEDRMENYKSKRLRQLITLNRDFEVETSQEKLIYFEDEEFADNDNISQPSGLLPDIIGHLQSFRQYIIWKDGKPIPKEGIISIYDNLLLKEKEIKRKLDLELDQIRISFKCPDISFAHIKERYEVEIPERKNIKIPKEYNFSSRKAGYSRYLVPEIQEIVTELEVIEKGIKTQMGIFVTFFFEQFKLKQNVWERYINILAEIDCYCGMAVYSKQKKTSRPVFAKEGYEVADGVHPALYSIDFVPNDISFSDPIILLTGPNMGGKSTTLRTSCLLAIMAQMGSYVPCRSYKASIIDRIFTRIGASDKLEAGKSTFFIEMEETKSIVNYATHRSLAIIDELGRGTATYDGMALAHSVLNYLITRINCKCFFATHYHSLTEEFASMPGTCLKMMDYEIIKGEEDRIEFLYKLVNGKAEKSFGLNVAQLVGLPMELIKTARVKSDEMHEEIERKKKTIKVYEVLEEIFSHN